MNEQSGLDAPIDPNFKDLYLSRLSNIESYTRDAEAYLVQIEQDPTIGNIVVPKLRAKLAEVKALSSGLQRVYNAATYSEDSLNSVIAYEFLTAIKKYFMAGSYEKGINALKFNDRAGAEWAIPAREKYYPFSKEEEKILLNYETINLSMANVEYALEQLTARGVDTSKIKERIRKIAG